MFLVSECLHRVNCCAGNNSQSLDIVRPNIKYVRPISDCDRIQCPNISPTHFDLFPWSYCPSRKGLTFHLLRPKILVLSPQWRLHFNVSTINNGYFLRHYVPPEIHIEWSLLLKHIHLHILWNQPINHCKTLSNEYIMYAYGLCLL